MKSGDIVIKEAIGIGDNEVDALNDAKKQLGLDENAEVDFEVIQRAEKKKIRSFSEVSLQRLGLLSKKLLQKKQNSF